MSAAVEDRIVGMKFDNKQFEPAAKTTLSTLDRLKAALNFSGTGKGLNDLQNTANRFSLGGLTTATQGVSGKFLAMSTVAITAIANIVNRAVDAGIKIANAFTLAPLKQGFEEYETNLNSVQTILANTQASGAKLKDVNRTLQELNEYSDKTIYNFSEMARNIGTFTAAGVDLETSAASIKGIANLAALSGSNSQQASGAMYQLSQAISAGRVSLQDWNSVVNAGMGGTVFQRALAQTAERMGTLDKGAVKLSGKMKNATINGKSFRESITAKPGEESWLTSEVLTSTLKQFTGDMSDAELASMGFTQQQIKSIQEQAKTAQNAATQVKTFTQLIGTLQEASGSGWAQTFSIMLGDFEEAKNLWTDVNNVLGGFIGRSAEARNKMLQDWKDMGGRTMALEGLRNIFAAIVEVIKPIAQAFRQIFPATTGKELYEYTQAFLRFTENLKIGAGSVDKLRRTFAGFFAIFSIGWSIVKGILNLLGDLFGLVAQNGGGFLDITASIGDFLVKLDQTIKKGDLVNKFFEALGEVIRSPQVSLEKFGESLAEFFGGLSSNPFKDLTKYLGRFGDRLEPLVGLSDRVSGSWQKVVKVFRKIADFIAPAIDVIKNTLSGIGEALAKAFEAGNFSSVYDALNTGLLTGIVLLIKKVLDKSFSIDFGGGLVSGIKDTFGALTDTLSALQTQIQAKTLLLIAGAVALLTASVFTLSMIDSKKLTKSLGALAVGFGQLLGAMAILSAISGTAGFIKVPMIAASMILLSTAVLILTAAVKNLSNLSWEELAKGLTGVGALLGMIVLVSAGLGAAGGSMLRAGLAMIPLAIGIKILASAVKDFSTMNWGEIAKGLTALAGSLLVIAGAMTLMPPNMFMQAAGLLVLSVALNAISLAMKTMGGMTWEEMAKGLITLAGSLVIIAGALYLMSGTLPGAAGLLVAAAALAVLAPVMLLLGTMKWGAIAKGLTVLAGALLIFAGGLTLMAGTLPGAAALLVASAALAVLTPVLITLGAMPWSVIFKGLVSIATAFAVIGVAGLLLTPVIPAILGLSAAFLILGASFGLIGVGAMALATAFSIFAAAGAAGIATLTGMISLIPMFLIKFAEGIIGFAVTIAVQGAKFVGAFASLIVSLLDAIIKIAPKIAEALSVLIQQLVKIVIVNAPRLAAAGFALIMALLRSLEKNIGPIIDIGASIIVKFLNGLTRNMGRLTTAGANTIIAFMKAISREIPRLADAGARSVISLVNGIANAIRRNQSAMNAAGRNLGSAIIGGMVSGIRSGISWVADWARYAASRALDAAKSFLGINSPSKEFAKLGRWSDEGLAEGLKNNVGVVESAGDKVASSAMDAVKQAIENMNGGMGTDLSLDPVITPILDLTQISQEASKIGGMLDQKAISADLSYRQALGISNERAPIEDQDTSSTDPGGNTYVELTQINNSPKALSTAEIYRDTKSQLALAKEAVTKR